MGEVEVNGLKFLLKDVENGLDLASCEGCDLRKTKTCGEIGAFCTYGKIWKLAP